MTTDYERVYEAVRDQIRSGVLVPGEKLPSIAQLATQYRTSQTTVKFAETLLKRDGWLRGQHGKGVYVADPLPPTA